MMFISGVEFFEVILNGHLNDKWDDPKVKLINCKPIS